MTSMPVKDVKFLVNFVGQQGTPATENAGKKSADFSDIMGNMASRASEFNPQRNQTQVKQADLINKIHTPAEKQPLNDAPQSKGAEVNSEKPAREPVKLIGETKENNAGYVSEETMAKITEKAEEIVNSIAEIMNVTPDEVLNVLAALNLVPESLLDPAKLNEVIVLIEETDLHALMTDEVLYQKANDLTAIVSGIVGEVAEETDLNQEQLKALITQISEVVTEEPEKQSPKQVTDSVNLTNETTNQKHAEPEQKLTIVVEKDGIITEVTARADDKGNLIAAKEVTTTEKDPQLTVSAQENTQDQSKQSGNDGGNKGSNFTGQEAVLNELLANRTNISEAKFEPIITEAPNTEQIMRQIMDFMKIQIRPEIDSIEMQLHPASLGTVGVKIQSVAGIITAQFTAQNDVVRAAIESQIIELRDTMRAQGIKVESIEVNVRSQEFDSKLWQGQDENNREEQSSRKGRRRINLSGLDELPEELEGEEKLTAEMMVENGQTVDFTA